MSIHINNLLEIEAKNSLKKILNLVIKIDNNSLAALFELCKLETHKKNHIIIEEGKISNHFYFVFKGLVKIYYYRNGKMVIDRFEKEGSFLGGNFTHITQKPGTHIYESLEDVVLLKINYAELDILCKKLHDIERLYRISIELFHTQYIQRLSALKSTSAEERYRYFVEEHSDIVNRVSLKDIANYLDMTSETISRIRARQQ